MRAVLRFHTLTLVACATVLAGCGKQSAPSGGRESTGGGATHYTIAVIPKGTSQSFWLAVKAGADDAGREEHATIAWEGPSQETDVDRQIQILQNAITRKVSAIVMAACDAKALVRYVQQAQQSNPPIPVVTIDSGLDPDVSQAYLATDNVKGGIAAADALADAIGGKGKVGVIPFIKGAKSSDEREQGFKEGLKKHPGMDLDNRILYSQADVAQGLDKAKAMITATPDIAGIFAANQAGAEGAIKAVKELNKQGQVKLVCFDASAPEVDALRDGTVSALIVQNPYQMGYQGVKIAIRLLKGEKVELHTIDTGVTVVTKANLDTPAIRKLLNPQEK